MRETLEKSEVTEFGYELGDLCQKYGVRFKQAPDLIVEDNRSAIMTFRDGCLLRFYDQFMCDSGVPDRQGRPKVVPPQGIEKDEEYEEDEDEE